MNLSDKIFEVEQEASGYTPEFAIYSDDVKQAVQKLKEASRIHIHKNKDGFHIMEIPLELFNKILGPKLI